MALLDGEGMGEEIRVLVQAKGIETDGLYQAIRYDSMFRVVLKDTPRERLD